VKIYIAGPYSNGDVAINVKIAIGAGERLAQVGFTPFIPHLSHFWHLLFPHEYSSWLAQDLEWLEQCDAVLRLPGKSKGADAEVKHAQEIGIPVFYNMDRAIRIMRLEEDALDGNQMAITQKIGVETVVVCEKGQKILRQIEALRKEYHRHIHWCPDCAELRRKEHIMDKRSMTGVDRRAKRNL